MIPLNDVITVYKAGKQDKWGIPIPSTEAMHLKGMVTYNTVLEELKTAEGEVVTVTGTAVFKGATDIIIGDEISIGISTNNGTDRFKVIAVYPVTDLSGKQLYTKVLI